MRTKLAVVACAAVVAGCGGGGGTGLVTPAGAVPTPTATPPGTGASTASVQFTMHWPRYLPASAVRRRPSFISPSTLSLTLAIDGNVVATQNAPSGGSLTTTITVPAPVASDTFAIALYDQPGGAGNLLGKVTVVQTIAAGFLNVVRATVNGQLAKIGIDPQSAFVEGSTAAGFTLVGDQALPVALLPEDADGNVIVMPGAIPALALSTSGSAITAAPDPSANTFDLEAVAPAAAQSFVASGTNLDGATVSTTFTVSALAAVYVAQYRTQKVLVYDELGTQLPLAATLFAGASNPQGVTFVPGSTPGSGRLVVTDATDSKVFEYDESGNLTAPAGTFPGLDQPFFATYDSASAAVLVPEYNDDVMSAYAISGTALAAGPFAHLSQPVSAAFDPHASAVFVVNFGPATIAKYDSAGNPLVVGTAAPSAGPHPMGATFDSNNDEIYVADAGYPVVELPEGGPPQPSTIAAFTETDTAISNPGGGTSSFTGLTYATDVVFDPYRKWLYVTDAGANKTVAFNESGVSETLGPSPFPNQSEPEGIALVP